MTGSLLYRTTSASSKRVKTVYSRSGRYAIACSNSDHSQLPLAVLTAPNSGKDGNSPKTDYSNANETATNSYKSHSWIYRISFVAVTLLKYDSNHTQYVTNVGTNHFVRGDKV